jgi:DNA-binding SARP family transcriptional activator
MGALAAESNGAPAVAMLGPLQVCVAGGPVEVPVGRLRALLAVLAMSAGQTVSVDRLVTAVWGGELHVDARANVQTNVKRLRRVLGAQVIVTRRGGYLLDVEPDQVDALRFVRLLDEAAATPNAATQRDRLVAALALWRGTPFDGVQSDWLHRTQVPRLHERYLAAVERRVDLGLREGDDGDLVAQLEELVTRFPLRESLWVRLLRVLERAGRPSEALERYERIRVHLAEELGADPGPELQQVHIDLLTGSAARPAPTAPLGGAQRVVPRQLPASIDGFAGRHAELKALDGLLGNPDDDASRRPVIVAAVTGGAGIGKTTLALHWAHGIADRFADGQLYVNLRGFDPSDHAVAPAEAIRGFLDALQVPPQQIPDSVEAQAGLYRSLLAGRRVLVLLDNARDADQVVPLLPGAPGCLVLVTSRNRLSGLVAATGAHLLTLDLLTADEARQLLARRLSYDRITAEPDATDEIIERCARLPLALAVVAARAATHPTHPLSVVADDLRRAGHGLGISAGDDMATDVRAVFSWSYHTLSAPAARLFRVLGLHPGPDVTTAAAASLAGIPVAQAHSLLTELIRAHVLSEHVPGRYTFHDLLRAYAAELAVAHDTEAERRAATQRMLDHYVHAGHTAAVLLHPHGETVVPAPARARVAAEDLTGQDQALDWFAAERPVLLAAIGQAARTGFDRHVCHLARALFVFLHRRGHWHDRAATQLAALDSAQRLGDRVEQARAHRNLAFALADLGRYDEAHAHLRDALRAAGDVGDNAGQAWTYHLLDLVYALEGRNAEALDAAGRALHLFQVAGDRVGEAIALTDVGWYQGRLGNHREAIALCRRALALHEAFDNRPYQAHTWSCLGDTHEHLGDHPQAIASYGRALELFEGFGDRYAAASTLAHLGAVHRSAGDSDAARDAWHRARDLIDELGQSAAEQIRTHLHRLDRSAAEMLFRR